MTSGLALTGRLAPAERRGALTGIFYTCAYLGFAAPFALARVSAYDGPALPLALSAVLAAGLAARLVPVARRGRV